MIPVPAGLAETQAQSPSATTDGSVDEIWQEHSQEDSDNKTETEPVASDEASPPAVQETTDEASNFKLYNPEAQNAEKSQAASDSDQVAPLCSLSQIKTSNFVMSGGWPGVGPFKEDAEDSNQLVDEANNKLKLTLSGAEVTEAELTVLSQPEQKNGMLLLQMTTDFFLEALGAQDVRIADFNSDFENKQQDLKSGGKDLSLSAGTYNVSIKKTKADQSVDPDSDSFIISVRNTKPLVSKSASVAETVAQTASDTGAKTQSDTRIASVDTANNTTPATASPSWSDQASAPETSTSVLDRPVKLALKDLSSNSNFDPKPDAGSQSNVTRHSGDASTSDVLNRQFTELMQKWQLIKKATVKSRQSQNLTKILGGSALQTQSQAVRFLLDNHRYYELTPRTIEVLGYKEITAGKKYLVTTKIEERRQYVDANKMEVLKDAEESYTVNYTVEKVRDAWLIVDFSKPLN